MEFFSTGASSAHHGQGVCAGLAGVALVAALSGCGLTSDDPPPTPDLEETSIDGTYTLSWSPEELREAFEAAGNPNAVQDARSNAGNHVLTMERGRYDFVFGHANGDSCPGTYVVTGDRVVVTATDDPTEWECDDSQVGETVVDARWTLTDDALTLTDWQTPGNERLSMLTETVLGTKPLQRVETPADN